MKTLFQKISLISCIMAFATYSNCLASTIGDDDNIITRTFHVTGFHSVINETVCSIHIIQTSGEYYMRAEGKDIKVNNLKVSVNANKELKIKMDKEEDHKNNNDGKINITIGMPQVRSLLLTGVGNFNIDKLTGHQLQLILSGVGHISIGSLKEDDTSINMSGVGNVKIDGLNTKNLTVDAEGVGSITLSGTAKKANYNVGSVCHMHIGKLKVGEMHGQL